MSTKMHPKEFSSNCFPLIGVSMSALYLYTWYPKQSDGDDQYVCNPGFLEDLCMDFPARPDDSETRQPHFTLTTILGCGLSENNETFFFNHHVTMFFAKWPYCFCFPLFSDIDVLLIHISGSLRFRRCSRRSAPRM